MLSYAANACVCKLLRSSEGGPKKEPGEAGCLKAMHAIHTMCTKKYRQMNKIGQNQSVQINPI